MLQIVAAIESLSSATAVEAAKADAEAQQALSLLAAQQPFSLELHAKLAKASLQAGAPAAAVQSANALLAAGLPKGRAAAGIAEVEDAPGVAQRDWQWLAVGSLVLGQVPLCLLDILQYTMGLVHHHVSSAFPLLKHSHDGCSGPTCCVLSQPSQDSPVKPQYIAPCGNGTPTAALY